MTINKDSFKKENLFERLGLEPSGKGITSEIIKKAYEEHKFFWQKKGLGIVGKKKAECDYALEVYRETFTELKTDDLINEYKTKTNSKNFFEPIPEKKDYHQKTTEKPTSHSKETDYKENYFTDSRDGKKYKYIKIGLQTWMAENLNFKTINSWYYENNEEYGKIYGRLYSWKASQSACPQGWHLPTDEEWKQLEIFLGITNSEASREGYHGEIANVGGKLKSK